ncbi:MAG: MarR family transcriptional regulator [Actinobacteria bacterium]|nr:MarR family transcriptional regulator [Actinomycetota bacterium]
MTERHADDHVPAEVHEPQAADLLDALVSLVASWSSPVVQGEIAKRMGLSINEADVRTLHTIGRFGSLRPAQLAAELYLTRPTTSKSLARLAGADLIERRSATDDARAAEITLTPDGLAVYERLVAAGIAMVEQAIAEVHPGSSEAASIAQFARALRRYASPENQPRPEARG